MSQSNPQPITNITTSDNAEKRVIDMSSSKIKHKWRHNPKLVLACLCAAGIVQGMIFTNVVISTIERRFGLDSTQSGFVAGSYDLGSLLAIVPITYFGGRSSASKPKYISAGMVMIALGSFTFSLPHFTAESYLQSITNSMNVQSNTDNSSSNERKLCAQTPVSEESPFSHIPTQHRYAYNPQQNSLDQVSFNLSKEYIEHKSVNENSISLSSYRYVFVTAQILHGIGAAALISLGVTYLDESVEKKDAPVFIGIFEASFVLGPALGYVIGGKLLSLFTEFYLLDDLSGLQNISNSTIAVLNQLSPSSPQWIGAWWIGFLLIVALAIITAFLLSLFPAKLKDSDIFEEDSKDSNGKTRINKHGMNKVAEKDDILHVNRCDYGKVKDMPKVIFQLISNATYVSMSFGATMDAFLLAGMAAFLPKYLESQFDLSPGEAAITVGVIVVPGGAGGTLLGGYLMKRFNLDRTGAIKMYLMCQAVILPLYLGFMYHCPTGMYSGVNFNLHTDDSVSKLISTSGDFNDSMCRNNCNCPAYVKHEGASFIVYSSTYEPVCSLLDKVTYYSACHAGCQFERIYKNQTAYYGCTCLQQNYNHPKQITTNSSPTYPDDLNLKEQLGIVLNGPCEHGPCSSIPLAVIIFFQILFTFMATMPGLVASLRSVEPIQRSLALGLQTLLIRGLGTVPGPIIFGYLIDRTCLMWQNMLEPHPGIARLSTQDLSDLKNGSCRVYDNTTMSQNIMAISIGWKTMSTLFMTLALYFSKKSDLRRNEVQNSHCTINNTETRASSGIKEEAV